MPKKARRVASRQAQLSGRARRVRAHGPAGVPPTRPPQPAQESSSAENGDSAGAAVIQEATTETVVQPEPARVAATRPSRARARSVQVQPAETYFAPELRRIGITFAFVVAVLVVLVFLLR